MRSIYALAFAFGLMMWGSAQAKTFDCGKPPPLANEQFKTELKGTAQTVGKIGQVGLSAALANSRSEVLSKYPNADRALADAYFNYQICSIVMNDPSLTSDQKMARLIAARKAFAVPAKVVRKPAPAQAKALPEPAASIMPATTEINQSGTGNIGVYNAGTIPLARREYIPKLQEFYGRGGLILDKVRNRKMTDDQLYAVQSEAVLWIATTQEWIERNMTDAAAAKFMLWRPSAMGFALDGDHSADAQVRFSNLNILMPQYLENLEYLTEHDGMDPQR